MKKEKKRVEMENTMCKNCNIDPAHEGSEEDLCSFCCDKEGHGHCSPKFWGGVKIKQQKLCVKNV